jgi:hypothetical protein
MVNNDLAQMAYDNQQAVLAEKAARKPTVKGVIELIDGKRLEYLTPFSYYLARAFYSKEGTIASSTCFA